MTRVTRILVLTVLLVSMVAPATVVGVGAAPDDREAQLAIQQPHYIDGNVKVTSPSNGTQIYHVKGSRIAIESKNFQSDNVVAYGVATDGAKLSYDSEFGEYVFSPSKTGTYVVYWTVEQQVTVNNSTGNGTHVETRQHRYEARLRVEGSLDMAHKPTGSMKQTREKAQKWEEFNATVQDLRDRGFLVSLGLKEPPTTDETVQQLITSWVIVHDTLSALSGNYSKIVTLVGMTLGGWLFVLTIILPLVAALAFVYYKFNTKESIEAHEGELSQRVAEFENQLREQSLANKDFTAIWNDDHIADAMRAEGENPLQASTSFRSKLLPRNAMHAYLQGMAQCGYHAVVDEKTLTDGGDEGDAEEIVVDAHVVHEDDLDEDNDVETMSLEMESPDDQLMDALNWSQDEILEFDLVNADFDRSEVNTTSIDTFDLQDLLELTDLDMRQFDDESDAAEIYKELFEDIREHPLTDEKGTPDTLRYWMEQHLDTANALNDRFEMPIQIYVDIWERALVDYDAGAEAEETLQDVREGAYA